MKRQKTIWALLIALLGITACSDNLSTGPDGPVNPSPTTGEEVDLHVSIQLPGIGAVPYSQIWIDNEAKVDTLDVYVFSNKKERDNKFTLEKIVPQDTTGATAVGGFITLQLQLEGRTYDRNIYFIANGASQNSIRFVDEIGWTTEEEFLASLTNASPQSTPLLMTAMVSVTAAQLQSAAVVDDKLQLAEQIELKRVAARIDIQNHERLLIIDSVQLFNTPKQSYIIGQASNAIGDGKTELTAWPVVNIRTHKTPLYGGTAAPDSFWKVPVRNDDPTIGDSVYIPSLYFPYENYANNVAADRQRLRIWGRVGSGDLTQPNSGTGVTYEVPLQAMGDSIARNHRYILLIRNILGSDLDATFKVNPWLAAEHDTIPYEVDAAYPSVTYNNDRLPGKTLDVVQAGGTITLAVDCNIQWGVEYEGTDASAWLSHKIMMDATTEAGSADIGKFLQLTFQSNGTGSERGYGDVWIKVYNKAEPGKYYRFTVKQSA